MTLLETPRSRIFIAAVALLGAAILILLFTRRMAQVHAAQHAVAAMNARMSAELANPQTPRPSATPVLVELFTSEGCSSCPPADALLARLDRDQPIPSADIIVLGEHVDYWDSLGWHDRFSSPDLTRRQKNYQGYFNLDDIYTPQTVVNGSAQFSGTDSAGIGDAIEKAASQTVRIQFNSVEVHRDYVTFTLMDGPATHPEYVNIYADLVDPVDTTEIHAGENKGRTLHHAGVVRSFTMVGGAWHMKELGRHPDQPFMIQTHSPASLDGMRLVVFAQTKHIGPILGAVSCVLSTSPTPRAADGTPFPANPCPTAATPVATTQLAPLQ
jgi:hypothetical protein